MDISSGNHLDLFALQQVNEWSGELRSLKSLRGRHGNYTLILRAQDLGTPSHLVEAALHICVTDFNDHAPEFITPPHNSTLRVPEVFIFICYNRYQNDKKILFSRMQQLVAP